jgi:hypothetical protein
MLTLLYNPFICSIASIKSGEEKTAMSGLAYHSSSVSAPHTPQHLQFSSRDTVMKRHQLTSHNVKMLKARLFNLFDRFLGMISKFEYLAFILSGTNTDCLCNRTKEDQFECSSSSMQMHASFPIYNHKRNNPCFAAPTTPALSADAFPHFIFLQVP